MPSAKATVALQLEVTKSKDSSSFAHHGMHFLMARGEKLKGKALPVEEFLRKIGSNLGASTVLLFEKKSDLHSPPFTSLHGDLSVGKNISQ